MTDEHLRRLDDYQMGKLTQAVETLTKEVGSLKRKVDDVETKMNKGSGFAIGMLFASGGVGAALATIVQKVTGH